MLWCLPFVLNQSVDTYKQKSFLLSNKKCYSLTWPDNERNKGAKTSHCTTCSMALVINTIKGKCNHVSWNSFKKSCFRALEVGTIGAIAQSWGKCKMEEESHPLMSFKIRLNFKAKPICKSYFVPLDWFGMTSIFDKLLISGHGCWWKEERILKSKY